MPVRQAEPDIWHSPCGERAKPDDVEIVDSFTGTPCDLCFMAAAMAHGAAPVTREEVAKGVPEAPPVPGLGEAAPEIVADGTTELIALSWRGKVVHRVTADAPRTELDGRPLVVGFCGGLGWGPHESAPDGWQACVECDQIAGVWT